MKLQLLEIILWSRNPAHEPRRLKFEVGKTNVITGSSKTGKSAVIPIVDYCLGSDRCAVPVSTIRDACSWFGVVIATDEGQKLLARREPGAHQSTGEMLLLEGQTVEIPRSTPEKNTSVDAVKRVLDRLAGLSNLGFDPTEVSGGFKSRPSFRDMAAFIFQPQNIVANPDVLFYKADTTEHREKLRTIFPYVIGAMTPALLAKQWELDQVQRDLKRLERELSAQSQATERWKSELKAWLSDARHLGLLAEDEIIDGRSESELIDIMRETLRKSSGKASLTASAVEVSSQEASALDREESAVALRLSEVRTRMEKMIRLRETLDDYTGALRKQRDRLGLSRWLREIQHDDSCPVCGGQFRDAQHELDLLCDALAEVEATARQMSPVPAAFDRELVQVREEVRRNTDQLQAVRLRKRRIEERSQRNREEASQRSAVDRFLGRVEQALSMYAFPNVEDEVLANAETLRTRLEELRQDISESGIRNRIQSALARISGFMSQLLPTLDAERPDDPVALNIADLTIRVTGASGRMDYLWEIGSGANWLSYHVATTLALHRLFLELVASPVPSMVVYDQPSQVYFPQTLAREPASGADPQLRDEDVAAVRKVFEAFGTFVNLSNGEVQVIVLDHAGSDVWGGLVGIHLVEEWRHGRALVPMSWLS